MLYECANDGRFDRVSNARTHGTIAAIRAREDDMRERENALLTEHPESFMRVVITCDAAAASGCSTRSVSPAGTEPRPDDGRRPGNGFGRGVIL